MKQDQRLCLLLLLIVVGTSCLVVPTLQKDQVQVGIDPSKKMDIGKNFGVSHAVRNYTIPASFLGFSIEISSIMYYFDQEKMKPRSWFVQLLKNLKEHTGRIPRIRLGGNSADWSWFNPSSKPRPKYITYDEVPSYFKSLKALVDEVGVEYYFGVNFLSGYDPSLALDEVRAISKYLGWKNIYAIQLGNEPDVYGGHYRAPGYTFGQYQLETSKYRDAIREVDSDIPYDIFSGPDFCCPGGQYYTNGPEFVRTQTKEYRNYGFHIYPLSACGGTKVTIEQLMADSSVGVRHLKVFKDIAKEADQNNKEWVISETNNICCEGYPGVSNTFASALWALDFMFSAASIGPGAMHFHASGYSYYTAIIIDKAQKHPDYFKVMPIYYAFLMFNEAIKKGSTLLELSTVTTNPKIKTWAVIDNQDQSIRLLAIQKDLVAHEDAEVQIIVNDEGKYEDQAEMIVLQGKDMYENSTITYAGQTFDGSTNGKPQGHRESTTIHASDNMFKLTIPPASAILLTIKRK